MTTTNTTTADRFNRVITSKDLYHRFIALRIEARKQLRRPTGTTEENEWITNTVLDVIELETKDQAETRKPMTPDFKTVSQICDQLWDNGPSTYLDSAGCFKATEMAEDIIECFTEDELPESEESKIYDLVIDWANSERDGRLGDCNE